MGFYQFKRLQVVNADLDTLWEFIANPANLNHPQKKCTTG